MSDSDSDYVQDASGPAVVPTSTDRSQKRAGEPRANAGVSGWEVTRTWEEVVEGADGTIHGTVEGLLEGEKRRRRLKDTTPLQRGIIRHLLLIIDLSAAMMEKDLRPTRHLLTLRYAQDFVTEYFEQNPISQLGILGMRDGLAIRISEMSGNPTDHIDKLEALRTEECKGQPSLQNALEMARAALYHAPTHTTREVLLVFGALLSSDPGDIHTTIEALVASRIQVRVIGLAAQVALCHTLVTKTNPSISARETYSVVLNEAHYRDLFMHATTPPATIARPRVQGLSSTTNRSPTPSTSSLLMMGFPSRNTNQQASMCACHSRPTKGGYLCSRCESKVCALPTQCPACKLTLILSTHLARSYHHLFPLQNWHEVPWARASECGPRCFGCLAAFAERPVANRSASMPGRNNSSSTPGVAMASATGTSETGRYQCPTCRQHFCIECDLFAHEVVHNCPGCQSRENPS